VKELCQQQEIHQIIFSQLEENSDSESVNNSEENQPENLEFEVPLMYSYFKIKDTQDCLPSGKNLF